MHTLTCDSVLCVRVCSKAKGSGSYRERLGGHHLEFKYFTVGVCDYQNMWYHDFADYCLESITINRLIGDLDNSAANKTIQLLQVLKVMLMPSADYQFNRSLQCASKIASAI